MSPSQNAQRPDNVTLDAFVVTSMRFVVLLDPWGPSSLLVEQQSLYKGSVPNDNFHDLLTYPPSRGSISADTAQSIPPVHCRPVWRAHVNSCYRETRTSYPDCARFTMYTGSEKWPAIALINDVFPLPGTP